LGYSFNKCLTENHEVVSRDRGRIKILDAKIGENILTYNPVKKIDEFYPIKNKYDNGLKKVYRIKTSSGKILECTLDHKIMTEDGMKTLSEIIEKKLKIKTI